MSCDEGGEKMLKPVIPAALIKQRRLGIIILLGRLGLLPLIFWSSCGNQVSAAVTRQLLSSSDKNIVIAVPTRNGEVREQEPNKNLSSFSKTIAYLGNRIKQRFLPESVKRVGQGQSKRLNEVKFPELKTWNSNEKRSLDERKFRPHQPDITSEVRGGKLVLPVVGQGDSPKPKPTPMANKLNPYTNGIASSFPPGIDPYEGFIRYAAENLETPMGNIVDYHSLEQFYGPQHPLSIPKDVSGTQSPYADSFAHLGNNNLGEIGNSPPPLPPRPPPPPHAPYSHALGQTHEHGHGFRGHSNSDTSNGNDNHYNLNSQEHGVDLFHATSPGQPSIKPKGPRDHPHGEAHFDHDHHQAPPPREFGKTSHPGRHTNKGHHSPHPPFEDPSEVGDDDDDGNDIGGSTNIPPPDLKVFEEGPPPELMSQKPLSGPPGDEEENAPFASPQHNQNDHPQSLDGGDDAIWGIIDLAHMLEKGQIPGQSQSPQKGSTSTPGQRDRVVLPIFTRPPPPRFSPASGGGRDADFNKGGNPFSASPNTFDYDEDNRNQNHPPSIGNLSDDDDGHSGEKRSPHHTPSFDSHESIQEYSDDTY